MMMMNSESKNIGPQLYSLFLAVVRTETVYQTEATMTDNNQKALNSGINMTTTPPWMMGWRG